MGVEGIRMGVATAGFQVEGGYNTKGEPTNNWADWERDRRVEPSGSALRFWARPEELLDRAAALGCDSFRFSVEWARVQPGFDIAETAPPPFDDTALDGYADLVVACRDRGLEPLITLHHFTHPRWAGVDFWGVAAKLALFADYVDCVVTGLGQRLVARHHQPVSQWITLNEVNVLALAGGLAGAFPYGGRRGPITAVRWLDHMVAAHCDAYDRIHDIHEAQGWARPSVSTNNYTLTAYPLDRLLTDLLLARENDVDRRDLHLWLEEGEADHNRSLAEAPGLGRGWREQAFRGAARRVVTTERLPFTVDALYSSLRPRKLDFVALDWYDPVAGRQLRAPGRHVGEQRRWTMRAQLDEQVVSPPAFGAILRGATRATKGQPVVVVENGLCSLSAASPTGSHPQRPDGLSRVDYLRLHLAEVQKARIEGVPVAGYYHWTVADNYEWGSYSPRFGIHSAERSGGHARILDHDAMGHDAASEFRRLTGELRAVSAV